jgi:hypothetical protein
MKPIAENVFFQDENVLITSTRVVMAGTTYPLRNITSVRAAGESISRPGLTFGLSLGAISGLVAVVSGANYFTGTSDGSTGISFVTSLLVFFLCTAIVWVARRQPRARYWIVIGTAGAESRAVSSLNAEWVVRIVRAINDAIATRG